jgi:glycosyltransferase involved in cell wall biosynthesis
MAVVGLLTTSYPRAEGDPAGLFVRGFANALASRGHRVEVLAPEPASPTPPITDPNIDVRWVRYAPRALTRTFYGAGVIDNVRRDPRAWPGLASFPIALARAANERAARWDAIVSHWALPCALAAGRVRADRPHLAVLHSADVHLMRALPMRARWASAVANGATALTFVSSALRAELLSWLPPIERADLAGRAHVSPMGIDPMEKTTRRAARAATNARGFVVLSLGRLVPIKGVDFAIDAVDHDDTLWIAGDGPTRAELERRAPHARFFGAVTGALKRDLFSAADVFVAPSLREPSGRTEGMPTTLLEAADAGLAIVASDVGGIGEVLSNERNALLVPPGDKSALRDAIVRLRADPALRRRLGRAARTIGKRHRWSVLAPRFEELLFTAGYDARPRAADNGTSTRGPRD